MIGRAFKVKITESSTYCAADSDAGPDACAISERPGARPDLAMIDAKLSCSFARCVIDMHAN